MLGCSDSKHKESNARLTAWTEQHIGKTCSPLLCHENMSSPLLLPHTPRCFPRALLPPQPMWDGAVRREMLSVLIAQPEAPPEAGAAHIASTSPIRTCQSVPRQKALLQEMGRPPKCLGKPGSADITNQFHAGCFVGPAWLRYPLKWLQ